MQYFRNGFFFFFFVLIFLISPTRAISLDIPELSRLIEQVSREVNGTLYIGGGSARAILDHLYFDKPLEMRDLDIFYVAGRQIDEVFARIIGEHLESPTFGTFSQNDLRSRPRGSQRLPILERSGYNAGYGFHWLRNTKEIIDLSIFHTEKDLALNGLFDIDTIMIVIEPTNTLLEFAELTKNNTFDQLTAKGWIKDPYQGYIHWQNQDPTIINWADIESDPILRSFRVIYTYSKVGQNKLPPIVEKNLEYLVSLNRTSNPLQLTRSLLKIMDNSQVYDQLEILVKIGVIKAWSPPLSHLLANLSKEELLSRFKNTQKLAYGRGDLLALGRVKTLIDLLPREEQQEASFDAIYAYSPETALMWMFPILGISANETQWVALKQVFEKLENKNSLDKTISRIAKSQLLTIELKRTLILRALLKQLPEVERKEWLAKMIANLSPEETEQHLSQVDRKRIGFYTGAFNPMHLGHKEVIKKSIEQQALDKLIVIPTIGTRHNGELVPWEDRMIMATISLRDLPEAQIISRDYKKELLISTGVALKRLFKEKGAKADFIHVMGTDSFERYAKDGHLEDAGLSQEHEVMVFHRPGTKFYPIPAHIKRHVYYFIDKSHEGGLVYSSSKVRRAVAERKTFDDQVTPEASDYIKKKNLYKNAQVSSNSLVFVTSNDIKFQTFQKTFPQVKRIVFDIPTFLGQTPEELVKAKLLAALDQQENNVVVLETFLFIDSLNNLPGTLTKDFMLMLGNEPFLQLMAHYPNHRATIKTILGYAKNKDDIHFFEAEQAGTIMRPNSIALELEDWQTLFHPDVEGPVTNSIVAEKLQDFLTVNCSGNHEGGGPPYNPITSNRYK